MGSDADHDSVVDVGVPPGSAVARNQARGSGDAADAADAVLVCDYCAEPAVIVRDIFLLRRGVPDRRYCMPHAVEAAWPFLNSERQRSNANG